MAEQRVANRYARALFNTALKQNIVTSVSDDLEAITEAIRSSEQFRKFLGDPNTSTDGKLALLDRVFGDKITATTFNFVKLLMQKKRDDELFGVKLAYDQLRRDHEKVVKAVIESATTLDEAQRTAIITKIESEIGRKLEPSFVLNPDLIMGVKVTYGDYVLDGSVRGQLDRMKEKLLYDLLKQA